MSQDPIDPVNPGKIGPAGQAGQQTRSTPEGNAFQKEMGAASTPMQAGQGPEGISPVEINQQGIPTSNPTFESLLTQTKDANTSLQGIKNDLNNNPTLKFKKSQEYLMKNKLADAQENIQAAGNRLGAQIPEPKPVSAGANPVQKFIGMVEDGQNQMTAAQEQINLMQQTGKSINPADMMLVQVKLSQAQQALGFTSILLGKVVETFKQWMNIQI